MGSKGILEVEFHSTSVNLILFTFKAINHLRGA